VTVLTDHRLTEQLVDTVHPLHGVHADYDPIMDLIGNAHLVLLGEATHGTSEFYRARADVIKRLILEKGFTAVAVEADWPDAYRVNRYVQSRSPNGPSGGFRMMHPRRSQPACKALFRMHTLIAFAGSGCGDLARVCPST
jgi:Erythromycin esterase